MTLLGEWVLPQNNCTPLTLKKHYRSAPSYLCPIVHGQIGDLPACCWSREWDWGSCYHPPQHVFVVWCNRCEILLLFFVLRSSLCLLNWVWQTLYVCEHYPPPDTDVTQRYIKNTTNKGMGFASSAKPQTHTAQPKIGHATAKNTQHMCG